MVLFNVFFQRSIVEGSKLIIFSIFIALVTFAFTTIPFISQILSGIAKDKQSNNDKSIIDIFVKAFSWHIVSVIVLLLLLSTIDIFLNNIEENFLKEKCLRGIFWNAMDKNTVMLNANATLGEYQSEGAYSLLHAVYTIFTLFYGMTPIFVFILSVFAGYKVSKNNKDNNSFDILFNLTLYVILGLFIYIAWITIANIAMYLPSGESLTTLKNDFWKDILLGG